jgi:hypothetical protein
MNKKLPTPWIPVAEVCHMYGVTFDTALNKIRANTFPVETYKIGKIRVIDREVHDRFFAEKRQAGLQALKSTKG